MKDYFRREKLSFKYNPIHWLGRLLFIFLIVTSGILQWIVVLFGSAFSISFVHSTEMEHMLPMSDKELIRKKLTKVGNVWLRYLVLGIIGRIYIYFASKNGWYGFCTKLETRSTLLVIGFFVLLMVYAYEVMLDAISENRFDGRTREMFPPNLCKIFIQTLPHIVFFVYAIMLIMSGETKRALLQYGPEWMHLSILLAAALLLSINALIERKNLKVVDYYPIGVQGVGM